MYGYRFVFTWKVEGKMKNCCGKCKYWKRHHSLTVFGDCLSRGKINIVYPLVACKYYKRRKS